MDGQEYVDMKLANTITEESWDSLAQKLAFIEFDAALEEYVENGKENDNGGKSLMDATPEQVERILDRFNQSLVDDDNYYFYKVGHLRDAICDVMGAGYLDR